MIEQQILGDIAATLSSPSKQKQSKLSPTKSYYTRLNQNIRQGSPYRSSGLGKLIVKTESSDGSSVGSSMLSSSPLSTTIHSNSSSAKSSPIRLYNQKQHHQYSSAIDGLMIGSGKGTRGENSSLRSPRAGGGGGIYNEAHQSRHTNTTAYNKDYVYDHKGKKIQHKLSSSIDSTTTSSSYVISPKAQSSKSKIISDSKRTKPTTRATTATATTTTSTATTSSEKVNERLSPPSPTSVSLKSTSTKESKSKKLTSKPESLSLSSPKDETEAGSSSKSGSTKAKTFSLNSLFSSPRGYNLSVTNPLRSPKQSGGKKANTKEQSSFSNKMDEDGHDNDILSPSSSSKGTEKTNLSSSSSSIHLFKRNRGKNSLDRLPHSSSPKSDEEARKKALHIMEESDSDD